MNRLILDTVETVAGERGLDKDVVFEALEEGMAHVARRQIDSEGMPKVVVDVDKKTGEYETWRVWDVLDPEGEEEYENPDSQMLPDDERAVKNNLKPGDLYKEPLENPELRRNSMQSFKQALFSRIRQAERIKTVVTYRERLGTLITAQVRRVGREGNVSVSLDESFDAIMPRMKMLSSDAYHMGDRVRAVLEVNEVEGKSPQLLLSRTSPNMVQELMKIEVPEVGEGIIEIKAVARDPGSRSKVAVKTNDARLDPVATCVGLKGMRVLAVSKELGEERINIIEWEANQARMVQKSLAPATIHEILMDEDNKVMEVVVPDEQIPIAIGRGGQNIKLTSTLVGWNIKVTSSSDHIEREAKIKVENRDELIASLDVDEKVANILINNDLDLETLAVTDIITITTKVPVISQDNATMLIERAKKGMVRRALLKRSKSKALVERLQELFKIEGMTEQVAELLETKLSISSLQDLADAELDDLEETIEIQDMDFGAMIMQARQLVRDSEASTQANTTA